MPATTNPEYSTAIVHNMLTNPSRCVYAGLTDPPEGPGFEKGKDSKGVELFTVVAVSVGGIFGVADRDSPRAQLLRAVTPVIEAQVTRFIYSRPYDVWIRALPEIRAWTDPAHDIEKFGIHCRVDQRLATALKEAFGLTQRVEGDPYAEIELF